MRVLARGEGKKRSPFLGTGAMAAPALRAPAPPRARPRPHPALWGAPGAEGVRLRIRWPPTGVPDGRNHTRTQELRISTAPQAATQANHTSNLHADAQRCTATYVAEHYAIYIYRSLLLSRSLTRALTRTSTRKPHDPKGKTEYIHV